MKHAKTITALGMLVALLPFLGFPSSWKDIIFALLGLTIATLSFRMFGATRNTQISTKDDTQVPSGHIAGVTVAHE